MRHSELRIGDLIVWTYDSWNKVHRTMLVIYTGDGRALYWGERWVVAPDVIFGDSDTDYIVVSRACDA